MNIDLLKEMIDKKYISVKKHPSENLFIYNYTPIVQYEKIWNEITLSCRGLILDENYNIIAKPFSKFFNIEEIEHLPNLSFETFEKMDGSLGILYFIGDTPYIASRGSFESEQAKYASNLLHTKYKNSIPFLKKGFTYLFEIIYPANRIVVDYGDLEELVLLTIIDNSNGKEHIEDIGFPVVKKFNVNNIQELYSLEEDNKEGFVLRYSNSLRIKIKFAEYVRLHRILTNISNINIWEILKEENSLESILDKVPDEFYEWVKRTENGLKKEFDNIVSECQKVYKEFDTRKETAEYFNKQKHPAILFLMLDKKNYLEQVWKLIKPKYSKPFKQEL